MFVIQKLLIGTLLAFAALLMNGCGESTNIQGNNTGVVTNCSSLLGVSCVTGRLIDDAAYNVNYECDSSSGGKVKSVTANDGSFSCPNGSDATFSLDNPENPDVSLRLGSVTVRQPAKIYGDQPLIPVYFYVTPADLAGETSNRLLNIVRLLQSISTDTTPAQLPSRRVIISDSVKSALTAELVDAIDFNSAIASDPASLNPETDSNTFDYKIKPYLDSIGVDSLISRSEAELFVKKGFNSTVAGMYVVPGGSILSTGNATDPNNAKFNADTGAIVGYDGANKTFVGSLWALVDRRGRLLASGIYSYEEAPSGSAWSIWSNPKPMELVSPSTWPSDKDLSGTVFQLLNSDGSSTGLNFKIAQGKLIREAVAGSSNIFLNLFDETAASGDLGVWGLVNGTTPVISNGAYTLEHTLPVATWMNPEIWNSSTNPIDFPLPITVTFFNRDHSSSSCEDGSTNLNHLGCKMGTLRMVILDDGNIVSDKYGKCGRDGTGTIDPDSLTYSNGDQEIPLGVVANSLKLDTQDGTGSTVNVMTLMALLANPAQLSGALDTVPAYDSYFKYLQFGSNLSENSLLRVDGSGPNKYQAYGSCSYDLENLMSCVAGSLAPNTASWVNPYTFIQAIHASQADTPDSAEISKLNNNAGGRMEMKLTTDCPAS